ncbi:hypothetical protein ACFLX1_00605 [Chloroflexota bacterium]
MCRLWAAIVSSGPAIVLGLSQLVVRDAYIEKINPAAPDKKVLFYSRVIAVVVGILTFVFALGFSEVLADILWAFAIGILIVIIACLGMKRVNEWGAFWGLLCGLVALIYWTIADHPFGVHEVYPMIGSVVIITLIINALTKRKMLIPEHIRESSKITK